MGSELIELRSVDNQKKKQNKQRSCTNVRIESIVR